MNEMYQSSPEVEEAEELEKTRDALGLLGTEVNSAETKEASKSNKEFGGVRLSYSGRYEAPGVNQEENLENRDRNKKRKKYTKPPFNTVNFADCRLNKRIGKVVYGTNEKQSVHMESYYSQRVKPGGALKIPGRHVADDGTVRDKDGYICVASRNPKHFKNGETDKYPIGKTVMTTLGPGKVYDRGDMTQDWIDIYVNW